jgi:hypothetical protein
MLNMSPLFVFYRNFFWLFTMVSLVCCYIMWQQQTLSSLFLFIPLKLFVTAVVLYFWHSLRSRELYFYHNLGFRKRSLYGSVLFFDQSVFILLVMLTAQLI